MHQVDVAQQNNPVSPLSLWERVRVRGFSLLSAQTFINHQHQFPGNRITR